MVREAGGILRNGYNVVAGSAKRTDRGQGNILIGEEPHYRGPGLTG